MVKLNEMRLEIYITVNLGEVQGSAVKWLSHTRWFKIIVPAV